MPSVEVDFETYKELVNRRPSESVSEGDVVKALLGLTKKTLPKAGKVWVSEGVRFWVGTDLRHRFRGGETVQAVIVENGVKANGQTFAGVSPAATFVAGHQANGWHFWEYEADPGRWIKIDALRHEAS